MKWKFFLLIMIVLFCKIDLKASDIIRKNSPGDQFKSGNITANNHDIISDTIKLKTNPKTSISAHRNNTTIEPEKFDDENDEDWNEGKQHFRGHLSIFEAGVNSFAKVSYSGYSITDFMDLNQNKSYEINVNVLRYNIGLQKIKNSIGLVTGMGFNFNDYRFSNPYTIVNQDGHVMPLSLDNNGLSKTKLATTYLTAPLLIEFQIPVNGQDKRIYFSGGVVGGLKLGSHTKVKRNSYKEKAHDDFNISPFRYGSTFRIGYRGINIFGTYYYTSFFKENRGPQMYPFTIGIGIMNR
jgi:hypothetical protein